MARRKKRQSQFEEDAPSGDAEAMFSADMAENKYDGEDDAEVGMTSKEKRRLMMMKKNADKEKGKKKGGKKGKKGGGRSDDDETPGFTPAAKVTATMEEEVDLETVYGKGLCKHFTAIDKAQFERGCSGEMPTTSGKRKKKSKVVSSPDKGMPYALCLHCLEVFCLHPSDLIVEHARERRDTQLLNEKSKIEEAEEKRAQKEEALLQKKVEHEKKPGCTVTIRDKSIEPPEEFDNELLETGEKWGQENELSADNHCHQHFKDSLHCVYFSFQLMSNVCLRCDCCTPEQPEKQLWSNLLGRVNKDEKKRIEYYKYLTRPLNKKLHIVVKKITIPPVPTARANLVGDEPKGLVNLTNTCYFNATMQCLARSDLLWISRAVRSEQNPDFVPEQWGNLNNAMTLFSKAMHGNELIPTISPPEAFRVPAKMTTIKAKKNSPDNLLNRFGQAHKSFNNRRQHDAHEAVTCIVNTLDEEEEMSRKDAGLENATPLMSALSQIEITTAIVCSHCGKESCSKYPFMNVSLDIPSDIVDSPEQERLEMAVISANKTMPEIPRETTVTLETCFTAFEKWTLLEGGNAYFCTRCSLPQGSETPPVEKLKIEETPGLLGGAEDDDEDDVEMEVQSESEDEEVEVDETGGEFDMEIHATSQLPPQEMPSPTSAAAADLRTAIMQQRISATSPLLIVNLKRFTINERGRFMKDGTRVVYPKTLNISSELTQDAKPLADDIMSFIEKETAVIKQETSNSGETLVYDLFGIVVHSGCLGGGHYVAYTRQLLPWNQTDNIQQVIEDTAASTDVNPQKDGSHWFYYSDTTVGRVSETTALASQAYVLYYRLRM